MSQLKHITLLIISITITTLCIWKLYSATSYITFIDIYNQYKSFCFDIWRDHRDIKRVHLHNPQCSEYTYVLFSIFYEINHLH